MVGGVLCQARSNLKIFCHFDQREKSYKLGKTEIPHMRSEWHIEVWVANWPVISTKGRDLVARMHRYFVYILTNRSGKVMYIGVTNNLQRRVWEHKNQLIEGFTEKYNVHKLVYFEETTEILAALEREKELKKWRREKKNRLVEQTNPNWNDLSLEWQWRSLPVVEMTEKWSQPSKIPCHPERMWGILFRLLNRI